MFREKNHTIVRSLYNAEIIFIAENLCRNNDYKYLFDEPPPPWMKILLFPSLKCAP